MMNEFENSVHNFINFIYKFRQSSQEQRMCWCFNCATGNSGEDPIGGTVDPPFYFISSALERICWFVDNFY